MSKCILYRSIAESSDLPPVCMQCGEVASIAKTKEFSWFPSWIYLLILFGILPFLLVVMMCTHRMKIKVSFCENHRTHFSFRTLIGLGGFLGLIGLFILNMVLFLDNEEARTVILCIVACLAVAWLIVGIYLGQTAIRPIEIDKTSMTLVNVNPAFVEAMNDNISGIEQQSIVLASTREHSTQTSYGGAIAQILLLGFAASVLLTIIGSFDWASFVRKQGYPFEIVLSFQLIAVVIIGFIILVIKRTERWSHLVTFAVLFCSLTLVTVVLLYISNQRMKEYQGDRWDDRKLLLASVENYEKSAAICLRQFETVANQETAEKATGTLNLELASLGGTVRSFAWHQDDENTSELAKEAEDKVQAINKNLKAAVVFARQKAGGLESFQELCDKYLQLVGKIERKEHLKLR